MVLVAFAFAAGEIVRKCADEAMDVAWQRLRTAWSDKHGGVDADDPPQVGDIQTLAAMHGTSRLPTAIALEALSKSESAEIIQAAMEVFGASGALRRAKIVSAALQGASILWVDDLGPFAHFYELRTLEELGVNVVSVDNSADALTALRGGGYDLVLSDMLRGDNETEGVRLLEQLRAEGLEVPMIFYISAIDPTRDRPMGSVGITNRPAELLHLVMDVLERRRL